jgi:hypothetical protein
VIGVAVECVNRLVLGQQRHALAQRRGHDHSQLPRSLQDPKRSEAQRPDPGTRTAGQLRKHAATRPVSTCDENVTTPPVDGQPGCRVVQTDATGRFSIEAQMFRPAPMACELGPVWFEKHGCATVHRSFPQPPQDATSATMRCEAAASAE